MGGRHGPRLHGVSKGSTGKERSALWKRATPLQLCLGPLELSLKVLYPLSTHMSVCATEAFKQTWLGCEYVGSASSGNEGTEAWRHGYGRGQARAAGQSQLCRLVLGPLHGPYSKLCSPYILPADPPQDGPLRAPQRPC